MMLQRYIPCNHYRIDHLIYRYTDNGQPADQYDGHRVSQWRTSGYDYAL